MKNKLLRGYSLLEVMLSVAIFAIMGSVLFGDTPSIGKSIAFNTEANLITDIVRDVQIKGSSGYVGTSTTDGNGEYSGLGLVFFVGKSDSNHINVFADKNTSAVNDKGTYKGNGYYDDEDLILGKQYINGSVITDKNSPWIIELNESVINRVIIGEKELPIYVTSNSIASILFQKGNTKVKITDLTTTNKTPTTSPLFIELESKRLKTKGYRCVIIEYSGSARVENGACQSYGSKIDTKTINNTTIQTVRTSSDNSGTPRSIYTPGTTGISTGNIDSIAIVPSGAHSPNPYISPINPSTNPFPSSSTPTSPSIPSGSLEPKVDNDGDGLIEINNIDQLNNIRYNLFGTSYKAEDNSVGNASGCPDNKCNGYELMASLDFNHEADYNGNKNLFTTIYDVARNKLLGWKPIGGDNTSCNYNNAFAGIFDGNGYTITNLYINGGSSFGRDDYLGLFGCTFGADIKNLSINEVYIRNGSDYIGGLIGYADNTNLNNIKIENKLEYISFLNNNATTTRDYIKQIVGGYKHSCALINDNKGTVKCWGLNDYGQLGTSSSIVQISTSSQIIVNGLGNVTAIAAGYNHSCALIDNSTVKCWGDNYSGQLGTSTSIITTPSPIEVLGLSNVQSIALGHYHSCALIYDGTVKCWGSNYSGQLSTSTITSTSSPISVSGIGTTTAISLGYNHTCALLENKKVKCWGNNIYNQLGTSTSYSQNHLPVEVYGLSNIKSISSGGDHSCALTNNREVLCWGKNENAGQLGTSTVIVPIATSTPIQVNISGTATSISAGYNKSCALLDNSTVKCWGGNDYGQLGTSTIISSTSTPLKVYGLDIVNSLPVVSHGLFACVIINNGKVKCWGDNSSEQLGVPYDSETSNPTPITIPVLLDTDKVENKFISLYNSFLDSFENVLASLYSDIQSILQKIFSPDYYSITQDKNSTNYIYGKNYAGGVVGYTAGVLRQSPVLMGGTHTCVIVDNGAIKCWGYNNYGQLGVRINNVPETTAVPKDVLSFDGEWTYTKAKSISLGYNHTCALNYESKNSVRCWGYNNKGQLGTSSNSLPNSWIVQVIKTLSNVTYIASNPFTEDNSYNCVIINDGTVKCWGDNSSGQLGTSTTVTIATSTPINVYGLSGVRSIALGNSHSCAVINNGEVKCWGDNSSGQLGTSTTVTIATSTPINVYGLSGVRSIALGNSHSCAVINNGEVKCWGNNSSWQLGTSTVYYSSSPISISGLGTATTISLGDNHSCSLVNDGNVWCWGNNEYEQLGYVDDSWWKLGTINFKRASIKKINIDNVRSISSGPNNNCVIKNDGNVWCWGENYYEQLGTIKKINPDRSMGGDILLEIQKYTYSTSTQIPGLSILFDIYKSSLNNIISIVNINKDTESSSDVIVNSSNRGGIIGGADNVYISDSSYSGYVYGGGNIGGIAGYINNSMIKGGISAGYVTSGTTSLGINIGRLVGRSDYSVIHSSIIATSTRITPIDIYGKGAIGYIIGLSNYSNISNSIVNLYNNNIKTSNDSRNTSTTGVGGIVGVANNTIINNNAIFENIPYTSNIYGTNTNIGGIVGIISGLSSAVTNNFVSGMTVWGYGDKIIGDIFGYKDSIYNSISTTGNSTTTYFVKKN